MRTVIFYSFKGGGGRTFTLANIAALLVRLRKRVLCIDLDLEAPGLAELFEPAVSEGAAREGFVDYVLNWRAAYDSQAFEGAPGPADKKAQAATKPQLTEVKVAPDLALVRAGDYLTSDKSDDYWRFLRQGSLDTLFPLPTHSGPPSDQEAKYNEDFERFWEDLREAIGQINPPPDYVLIDTRTGISPLSATTIEKFLRGLGLGHESDAGAAPSAVDVLVFAERGSNASLRGTQAFLKYLASQKRAVPRSRITLVTREQRLHGRIGEERLLDKPAPEWLAENANDPAIVDVVDAYRPVRSDPEVENTGKPLAPLTGSLTHRGLLDDFISIAALLLQEPEHGDAANADTAARERQVKIDLGLDPDAQGTDYKLFVLPGGGGLSNLTDEAPNISFSLPTFGKLTGYLSRSGPEATEEDLVAVGAEAGEAFGTTLIKKAPSAARGKLLEEWRALDSAVGWGRFEFVPDIETFVSNGEGRIDVYDNSFAPDDERPDLCPFLAGYLSGIVTSLLGRQLRIIEDHVHGEPCSFVFASPGADGD